MAAVTHSLVAFEQAGGRHEAGTAAGWAVMEGGRREGSADG